jgi:beta-galactosidase
MQRRVLFVVLIALISTPASTAPLDLGNARRVSLDADWRFLKGDAEGAEQPAFDDHAWRALDVPHDWAIEGPFDKSLDPSTGALPYAGVGWYRRHFTLTDGVKGRHLEVLFDGAMSNARVWLNGHEIASRPYGYSSFGADLTPYLAFSRQDNVLAVRLAPEPESSRWYPGAGIYRHVWLDVTDPVHVARWGSYITTPEVNDASALVNVGIEIANATDAAAPVTVESAIVDADGTEIVRGTRMPATAPAGSSVFVENALTIPRPVRWDLTKPYLYRAVTVVRSGADVRDRYVTPFGIRTIAFDKTTGFMLNGRRVKLQGVCLHHDLGALGTAVNRRALERQLQIMKAMGVNAIRTSHNPPAPELLDLADTMGLVVMDEAFDMWNMPKVKNGYAKFFAEWGDRDLRDMIRRDRNHPSIVLWSIGNEILEQGSPGGGQVAKHLSDICHQEDPTRPTTAGFNQFDGAIKNGLAAAVDVPAFNYAAGRYPEVVRDHPNWPFFGSETASAVSTRGAYHLPIEKYGKHPSHEITSYDVNAPFWAYIPDWEFEMQAEVPQVAGEFVWTGFDYLGEPTPYYGWGEKPDPNDWPARSSYFGVVDLAGFPKDRYYLYQSMWTSAPMVHVLPHWNWTGHEKAPIPVMVYSNADEVELSLNGVSLGRKKVRGEPVDLPVGGNVSGDHHFASKFRLRWDVPYQPGTLKAVAYRDGKAVAEDVVRTAGAPAKIVLSADRSNLDADGRDLSFITVRVEDKNGVLCPDATNQVQFTVTGPGKIAGVDNGDSASLESFQANHRAAFHGMALLIIRSEKASAGTVTVSAESDGLSSATTSLSTGASQ